MALNKHMQAAVDEINGDIAQLQKDIEQLKMIIDCIDRLYGGEEPSAAETAKQQSKAKASPRAEAGSALEKAAGMQVPITAESLVAAVGLSKKAARSLIQRWNVAGWVEKTGWGEYSKTDKFPAAVIPAE